MAVDDLAVKLFFYGFTLENIYKESCESSHIESKFITWYLELDMVFRLDVIFTRQRKLLITRNN